MPAKLKEVKKIKQASPPKDYDYKNDTVYTSYEGLTLKAILRKARFFSNPARLFFAIPEAMLIGLLIYYLFTASLKSLNFVAAICIITAFYFTDIAGGALIAKAKMMKIKLHGDNISIGELLLTSLFSLQQVTYILLIIELYTVVALHSVFYSVVVGIVTLLLYTVTIRFGMASMFLAIDPTRKRGHAIELSMQYFSGSFMKLLILNIAVWLLPIMTAFALAMHADIITLTIFVITYSVFMVVWQDTEASAFNIINQGKKVNYVIS